MKRLAVITSLLICLITSVAAGEALRFSVITCMPGSEIYELEGHAGIRVQQIDTVTGAVMSDVVVDWGNFDFTAPNFVYRFVKGETDYSIGARPTPYFMSVYASQGRKVYEQPLSLTDTQKLRLMAILNENFQPENRIYRYNYVKDNCATRIVEVIEKAANDSIALTDSQLPAQTFREAMTYYHANYPWYQFGINLALGAPLDNKIDDRKMMFSPEALHRMLMGAEFKDGGDVTTPSVLLVNSPSESAVLPATPPYLTPMAVSLAVLAVTLIVAYRDVRRKRPTRLFYSLLYGIYGILGLILTFLIFISVHEATSPNWLYLWINPLCLIAAAGVWVKKAKKLVFCYQIVNFVLLIILLVIFMAGVQQPDAAFYPLILADMIASSAYIYICICSRKTIS
ncbi:MAG: DUF4105 domain-containing protein [Bacteroides sp.]|nr:DUF4105 domain-containing protein [Bacteroides sp.]